MTYAENFKPMALMVMIALALFVSNAWEKADATQANMQIQAGTGQKMEVSILSAGQYYPAEIYHQGFYQSGKLVLIRFGLKPQAQACGRDTRA